MSKILITAPGEGCYYMEGAAFDFWTSIPRHCYIFGDGDSWDHDCGHGSCDYYRDRDAGAYLEGQAHWHFDTNWGRSLPDAERMRLHDLLVRISLERAEVDDAGLPVFQILAAVYAGVSATSLRGATPIITDAPK